MQAAMKKKIRFNVCNSFSSPSICAFFRCCIFKENQNEKRDKNMLEKSEFCFFFISLHYHHRSLSPFLCILHTRILNLETETERKHGKNLVVADFFFLFFSIHFIVYHKRARLERQHKKGFFHSLAFVRVLLCGKMQREFRDE